MAAPLHLRSARPAYAPQLALHCSILSRYKWLTKISQFQSEVDAGRERFARVCWLKVKILVWEIIHEFSAYEKKQQQQWKVCTKFGRVLNLAKEKQEKIQCKFGGNSR